MNVTRTAVVILLAGMGSRLGRPYPKSLTPLGNGETILSRQLRLFSAHNVDIYAVVGFKKELIMEAAPQLLYVYNPQFDTTNTSKSLLCALRHLRGRNVVWANGDVVFDAEVINRVFNTQGSAVAVNNAKCGAEEVKYTVGDDGFINAISKKIESALGEALGINKIAADQVGIFCEKLVAVDDNDYFERAMELLIAASGSVFTPVDVSDLDCVEVDFEADLEAAKTMVQHGNA